MTARSPLNINDRVEALLWFEAEHEHFDDELPNEGLHLISPHVHPSLGWEDVQRYWTYLVQATGDRRMLECGMRAPGHFGEFTAEQVDEAMQVASARVDDALIPLLHGYPAEQMCAACAAFLAPGYRAIYAKRAVATTRTCPEHLHAALAEVRA